MITSGDIVFGLLALLILGSGILVVTCKNIVRSAYSLVFCFLGVAGLYALLNFGFLALAQVLVYAGAISVLILFAILTVAQPDMDNTNPSHIRWWGAGIVMAAFSIISLFLLKNTLWFSEPQTVPTNNVETIAELLLGKYTIPLEVTAILLLVALVGSVILVKEEK